MISPLTFPQVVERKVENLKILEDANIFPLLENSHLFNIFRKTVFRHTLVFTYSLPLFTEKRSSRKNRFLRFHNFIHIFSFSTSHLFKNFHTLRIPSSFPQNPKSFPLRFPLENTPVRARKSVVRICVFQTFPVFLHGLKQLLLKKYNVLFFQREKGNLCFF